MYAPVFLISSYDAPLTQRASYVGTAQLSLWASSVNYDYIVINSIKCLLRCTLNSAHTNHCRANLAHASKTLLCIVIPVMGLYPNNAYTPNIN